MVLIIALLIIILLLSGINTTISIFLLRNNNNNNNNLSLNVENVQNHYIDELYSYCFNKSLNVEIISSEDGQLSLINRDKNQETKKIFDLALPNRKIKINSNAYKALLETAKEQVDDFLEKSVFNKQ